MRTDTAWIPVIDVDPVCSWCYIRLKAVPDEPVVTPYGIYHPGCKEAELRQITYRLSLEFARAATVEMPEVPF